MSTSLLVAKERQPSFPFGLGQKQAKKPKSQKIRCKCATVARYSMLYRVLCNALQWNVTRLTVLVSEDEYKRNQQNRGSPTCTTEYGIMYRRMRPGREQHQGETNGGQSTPLNQDILSH